MSVRGTDAYEPTAAWLRRFWRRWRGLVAIAVLVLVIGTGFGLASGGGSAIRLDPSSARPDGGRALATLLEQRGVAVRPVERYAEALRTVQSSRDATLLVTSPDTLPDKRRDRLAAAVADAGARLVILEPGEGALRSFAPDVHPAGETFETVRKPECDLPAARAAGAVTVAGPLYRAPQAEHTCYSTGTRSALVRTKDITVLGAGSALQNEHLDQQGNAALGLNLLGGRERLIWYVPTVADNAQGGGRQGIAPLLPPWVHAAVGMLAVATVLGALAAARRLGPVSTEPLPVRVPAAEATHGRARLYRRRHATAPASAALRAAARHRIARRLGLPSGPSDDSGAASALAAEVAARTGRPESEVAEILDGAAPPDDDGLVALADRLDRLEEEVSRS